MSLVAAVEDGKIVESASQTSIAKSQEDDTYSKDTFLQLLVAEVQNQDPLEPTSNTEWVSQYATFSELEIMQNLGSTVELSRASSLVGKTVVINSETSSGQTVTVEGKVDYVTYESGKAYVSVNGSLYSLDDVYNVVDSDYLTAFNKVYDWTVALNKLPAKTSLTLDDADDVEAVYEEYAGMSDYEKTFVASDNANKIEELYERIQELRKAQEAKEEEEETAEETEEADETQEAENEAGEEAAAAQGVTESETQEPESEISEEAAAQGVTETGTQEEAAQESGSGSSDEQLDRLTQDAEEGGET